MNIEKWIPCSERLPKIMEDVLITQEFDDFELDGEHRIDVSTACLEADGEWFSGFYNEEIMDNYKVIAWMPLPEPYKGD